MPRKWGMEGVVFQAEGMGVISNLVELKKKMRGWNRQKWGWSENRKSEEERYQAIADTGRPGKEDSLNLTKIHMIYIFPEGISFVAKMLGRLVITSSLQGISVKIICLWVTKKKISWKYSGLSKELFFLTSQDVWYRQFRRADVVTQGCHYDTFSLNISTLVSLLLFYVSHDHKMAWRSKHCIQVPG